MNKLVNSDVFDSGCEMIVLPISTRGSISPSFQKGLEKNKINIELKRETYNLGDVEIHSILKHRFIKYIVLACSVQSQSSTYLALEQLGTRIAHATKRSKKIKSIGIPLLGAGAGRLNPSKSLNTLFESFYITSRGGIDLIFCVPDNDMFFLLKREMFTAEGVSILRVRQLVIENLKTKSKKLDLGNCGLRSFDVIPELFRCKHLEELILSNEWGEYSNGHWVRRKSVNKGIGNLLLEIPDGIKNLSKLRTLICGGDWDVKLSNHQKWSIQNISILSNLTELTVLNVSNNELVDVSEIVKLKKLQKLYLNNNDITSVPSFSGLKSLSEIFLSNNKISNVEFLKDSFSLKTIDLHSNHIHDLTPIKALISKIGIVESKWTPYTINVASNPLIAPRPELISQGKEKVLAYLEQLEAEKDIDLNLYINKDIKLILVGNSNTGKSTLLHWLKNKFVKKDIPTTHWMVVDKWQTKFKNKEYTIRIFDFGGQEYYHDTHHLFFTNQTAYIILWEKKSKELDEIEIDQIHDGNILKRVNIQSFPLTYWLESIYFNTKRKNKTETEKEVEKLVDEKEKSLEKTKAKQEQHVTQSSHFFGDKRASNILIVQNKVESISEKVFIDQNIFKENYSNIFDFMAISVWSEKGLLDLEDSLFQLLDTIPILGRELLGTWGIIKNKIEFDEFDRPYEIEEFKTYCNNIIENLPQLKGKSKDQINKVLFDYQDTQSFAQYLNDIGVLLYFPESKELGDRVFVNQRQVLKNIYDVLKGLNLSRGEFNLFDAGESLKSEFSGDIVANTINVMLHFKIIFEHPAKSDTYIAPLYLPREPAESIKIFMPLFRRPLFRYEHKKFIYKNIILAFFNRYGQKALKQSDESDHYYFWKEGIVLRDYDTGEIILVRFCPSKKNEQVAYVDVYKINGNKSSKFLDQVIHDLDIISEDWNVVKTVANEGGDFIPLNIVHENEVNGNWIFNYNNKVYKLIDFKKHLKQDLKMKKVFISYSKTDVAHLTKLENHLSVLKRNGTIGTWNCRKLLPGEKWDGKIKKELQEADLILFLVSDDFLATDYIWDIEIKRAIERDNDPDDPVAVVPIIVRACDWEDSPLGVFNTAPKKAEVINSAENVDVAWTKVVKELKAIL